MNSINLIPHAARLARAQRRLIRRWSAALALAAVILLPAALLAGRLGSDQALLVTQQLAHAREQADIGTRRLAQLNTLRFDADRRHAILTAIRSHPDWSHLLTLLADLRTDDTVFARIDLSRQQQTLPAPTSARTPPAASATPPATRTIHTLALEGHSRSPAAAAALVVRLERTGLFSAVRLLQTRPDTRLGPDAVAFKIESTLLGAPTPPTPAPTTTTASAPTNP